MMPRADHFRLGMLFAAMSALTFGMSGPLGEVADGGGLVADSGGRWPGSPAAHSCWRSSPR